MRFAIIAMLAAGTALAACGATANDQPAGEEASETAPNADLSDGLITCAMPDYDGVEGVTLTQTFILTDGQVKRFSDFQNVAFDLCEAGQEGCSLGIDQGIVKMEYTSPKGVGSRYHVNLDTMQIRAWESKPGEDEREVAFADGAQCTRSPLPEGLTIN